MQTAWMHFKTAYLALPDLENKTHRERKIGTRTPSQALVNLSADTRKICHIAQPLVPQIARVTDLDRNCAIGLTAPAREHAPTGVCYLHEIGPGK